MKVGKLVCISLVLSLGCSSYRVRTSTPEAPSGSLKGLRLLEVIGERPLGSSALYLPTGIAIDFPGNIFVTDSGNDRVVKCDSQGGFLGEVGGFGWAPGEFNRPAYITTDNGLNVYVVDAQNKRIQRFDHNLNFIFSIEIKEEDGFSKFGLPEGIAISPSGELLVSDIEGDVLVKLNSFFEYERSLGDLGETLRDPFGIFVTQNGDIYVADSQNDRVVVFNPFGTVLKSFGEKVLKNPKGVTVGSDKLVYVANTGKNSVAVFDPNGNLVLEESGEPGVSGTAFSRPTDLKLGKDNRLFVVDSGNSRILIFELVR